MNVAPWIILFAPLASAFVIVLITERAKKLSSYISVAAIAISFVFSLGVFAGPDGSAGLTWIDLGSFKVIIGYLINDLTKLMLLIVTGVGLLIHIYSIGYMGHDKGRSRYFAGLSLFTFSMLGIVLANNFIMMFIFWELVGFSSYVLIGHWFYRPAPPDAANKAFLANRIGDFGFMLGILLVWLGSGTVSFDELGRHWETIGLNPTYTTAAALLIFCGAIGKSAQFPLHVWLPDAMEGPTPVSALIHAATMVAAGVFMLVRSFFLFQNCAIALAAILSIGLFTSLMAALMATQQDDIKRILAYSTLSELGLMMGAVGLGAPQAGMFQLFTHASFKALLFLGAGSVIHSLDNEQNIWRMGGLQKRMPVTFWTFLIGSLALIACPPFSGFWSEDEILAAASQNIASLVVITAIKFLTAYFVTRLFVVAFLGQTRSDQASHAHESPRVMTIPLILLAISASIAGFPFISSIFIKLPEHEGSLVGSIVNSIVVIGAGVATAYFLYKGKTKDAVDIPLFEHKFYFDEFYGSLIKWTQDLLANISAFVDRWVIDGGVVRGLGGVTWGLGFVLRFLQIGNVQAYAFLFGAGVVLLIYYILFGAK
jgi:NADH-quinone oxidoreductase subunit L